MASLCEDNLNKTLIIKRLPQNFCQNTNCSYNNYNEENDRDIDFTVVPEQKNFISPKKIAERTHHQHSFNDKKIYSENRYKGFHNSESNTQLIDDVTEEKVHRSFKTGSRDNFKDNCRPANDTLNNT